MCNTAPLLRINFQAIKQHKQSDRRRQPNIAKELKEVKRRNTPKVMWGRWVRGMEVPNSVGSISQVGNQLPGPISFRPTFPVNKILQAPVFVVQIHNELHFIFLFAVLCNIGGARGSHRLTWEAFTIWLYERDIDDRMNVHRAGKMEFNGVGPNQLHDGIGAKPSFQQLLRGTREMEVIGGQPDLIPNGIWWGI